MNTAMAEVAEGMDNKRNILFCQVPSIQVPSSHPVEAEEDKRSKYWISKEIFVDLSFKITAHKADRERVRLGS